MKAVGRLHSSGVTRRMRTALPYPACTISSVPYVPPDTMKKVAMTSGQNRSLADCDVEAVECLVVSTAGRLPTSSQSARCDEQNKVQWVRSQKKLSRAKVGGD